MALDWHKYHGMPQFLLQEGLRRLDMELEVDERKEMHCKNEYHISCMFGQSEIFNACVTWFHNISGCKNIYKGHVGDGTLIRNQFKNKHE